MLETLPWDSLGPSGIATLLAWTLVRLVVSGKFVPREQVDMLLSDLRDRVKYMEAEKTADSASMADLVKQNQALSLQGELSVALLRALQSPNSSANSGSEYVAPSKE